MVQHTIETRSDYIFVVCSGVYTDLSDFEGVFEHVLNVAATSGQPKVLFDLRPVRGEPQMIDRYFFGEWLAQQCQLYVPAIHFQIACIGRYPFISRKRHSESVFRNRGGQGLETDSPDEAAAWLGIDLTEEDEIVNRRYPSK